MEKVDPELCKPLTGDVEEFSTEEELDFCDRGGLKCWRVLTHDKLVSNIVVHFSNDKPKVCTTCFLVRPNARYLPCQHIRILNETLAFSHDQHLYPTEYSEVEETLETLMRLYERFEYPRDTELLNDIGFMIDYNETDDMKITNVGNMCTEISKKKMKFLRKRENYLRATYDFFISRTENYETARKLFRIKLIQKNVIDRTLEENKLICAELRKMKEQFESDKESFYATIQAKADLEEANAEVLGEVLEEKLIINDLEESETSGCE